MRAKQPNNPEMKQILPILFLFFFPVLLRAQQPQQPPQQLEQQKKLLVKGKVVEQTTGESLPGASVVLLSAKDSTQIVGAATSSNGTFSLTTSRGGRMILRVSYIGFKPYFKEITLRRDNPTADLGTITLHEDAKLMQEANVVARLAQVEMKADTFVYNADAYRMPEGAVLEELVKKLPGAEVAEDGTITINGKTVKKILVDGKEFFGEDTKLSMKNIPTKMVKNVKAYDKQSDYSRVTGIDDGEEETVLDLTVKKGMKEGWLVNLEGGYGTEDRYTTKANVMRILDQSQFAVFASSNNVGDRNMGTGGRGGSGGGGGIVSSQMAGVNGAWENGKRQGEAGLLKTGGSVRFFRTFTETQNKVNSQTFLQDASSWANSISASDNLRWNLNTDFHMEWMPDSLTNIIFRPSYAHSYGNSASSSTAVDFDADPYEAGLQNPLEEFSDTLARPWIKNFMVNSNETEALSRSSSDNVNASLQVNRRLGKLGRNLTLNLQGNYSVSQSDDWNISQLKYFKTDNQLFTNRYNLSPSTSYNISSRLSYTEPITRHMNLQGSYQFQYRFTDNDRSMYDLHSLLQDIGLPDYMPLTPEQLYLGYIPGADTLDIIRNRENSQYATYNEYNHNAQLLLRYTRKFDNGRELRFNLGASFQPQTTHMDYTKNNLDTTVVRNVFNWAPRIRARWKINQGSQLSVRYMGRMAQPSMTNLLEVMDNTNPQNVSLGNAGLESSWTNSINLDYNGAYMKRQMTWAARLSYSGTDRSVASATIYDAATGNRYVRPMNIDGQWKTSANLMFSSALDTAKHFNINSSSTFYYANNVSYISTSISDLQAPETIEDLRRLFASVSERGLLAKATTRNFNMGKNMRLSYRTEWGATGSVEVGLNGGFRYQHARNESNPQANIDSWTFNYGGNFTVTAPWGTTFNTEIGPEYRRGFADESMNTTEIIWNAQISHAFLRKKNLVVSAQWFDILQQRSNISRAISATMRSDTETNAINSYVMFKVAYKPNLLGGKSSQSEKHLPGDGPAFGPGRGPGGGMPPMM